MSSNEKDTKTDTGNNKVVEQQQTKDVTTADELDLDKNPVQFRTWDGKLSTEAHDKDYMEISYRSGNHSELVKRILRQRIDARAKDFPRWPAEMTSGVRSIWIESRFWYDRERLSGDFDNDWREYRAKYLHSLELHPNEPVHVPEYEIDMINPIRRTYMIAGDWLEDKFISKFARDKMYSAMYRVLFTRGIMIWAGLCGLWYWQHYNAQDWTERHRPRVSTSRTPVHYGHPNFPFKDFRTEPAHHADCGFSRRTIYKDLRDYEDTSVVL